VIAFDCDDVLIPTAELTVKNYNDRFDTNLQLRHFYSHDDLTPWGGVTYDEAIGRVFDFLRSEEYALIAPHADAVETIRGLAKDHELHVVTGRPSFLKHVTKSALDTHFPGCFKSIEHTNYITLSTDTEVKRTKGEVCRVLGADILVDDHIAHADDVLSAGLKAIVFGNYPWSQRARLPRGIVRCKDWEGVKEEIAQHAAR
jgi:hypothetical protein